MTTPPDAVPIPLRSRAVLPLLVVLCLASRLYFVLALPWCAEDAYITFRYAENWAHGLGPVYNAGDPQWGFTSALWTGVLALVALVGIPLEPAARGLLVACDLVTLVLGFRLLDRHSRWAAAGFGLFFATWPRFAHMPASGLEPPLVFALLLAAATFAASRFGGLLNGLLALSRPEGATMSLLLAWRLSWRQRAVWIGVAALQGLLSLHFGRLAPSSVSSKATVYGVRTLDGPYWLEWLIPGMPPLMHDGEALAPVAILFLTGIVAVVARWRRDASGDAPLPLLFACGLLTLFGYLVLGVPPFFWYLIAPLGAILLAAFLGLGTSGVLRVAFLPLVVFLAVSWFTVAPRTVTLQTHNAAIFSNLGQTLRADAAGRPASVLLEPIGIVGYTSGLRVLDEVGLVTPWVAEERRRGDGWYARLIARDAPDYVVIRRDWLEGGVDWAGVGNPFVSSAQAESTMAGYETLRTRAAPGPAGSGTFVILKRKVRPGR